LLIEKGVSLVEVARIMGHKDISMTLRVYAYYLPGNDKSTAALQEIAADLTPRTIEPIRRPMTRLEIDRAHRERRKALKALPPPRQGLDIDG
jgi:hypothetical protein